VEEGRSTHSSRRPLIHWFDHRDCRAHQSFGIPYAVIVGGEYDLRQSDTDILLPLKIRDLIASDYSDEASVQDLIEHYESFGSVYAIHSLLFIASSKSHVKPMVVGPDASVPGRQQ
jgi:hypothetical protein